MRRILHRVVVGKVSLQHDLPRSLSAPRSPFHLGQQLESTLRRTEVWEAQRHIGPNHAYQRDSVNVVPFGDHLRPYQQVEFPFVESVERAFEIFAAPYRVAIEPSNARLRKHSVQQFFQLFGPGTEKIDILTAAMDAGFG